MARFCSKCGGKNEDDAKFCVECGAPFASKPASPASPGTAGAGMPKISKKLILLPLGVMAVLGIGAAVWTSLDPNRPSEGNYLKAVERHIQGNAAYIDKLTCAGNMPYQKNPMRIGFYDGGTREWMDKLKAAGVYSEPEQGQSGGFFSQPQLVYSLTEQGAKSVRGNKLCMANGIKVTKIIRHDEPRDMGNRKAVQVTFGYELKDIAPWAQAPETRQGLSEGFKLEELEQSLALATGKEGWEVVDPAALSLGMRADRTARAKPEQGFFAGLMNSLSGLFSFGGPTATVESFYRAVESGDIDKAQSLLSGQVYALAGDGKIRAAMEAQSRQIKARGGIKSIETKVDERESHARVTARVVFGDGGEGRETLKLIKENGSWKIAPDK